MEIQTSEADGYLTNWDIYCSLYVAVVNSTAGEQIGYLRIGTQWGHAPRLAMHRLSILLSTDQLLSEW